MELGSGRSLSIWTYRPRQDPVTLMKFLKKGLDRKKTFIWFTVGVDTDIKDIDVKHMLTQ